MATPAEEQADSIPYWTANGFRGNPFESTNAADEELLSEYFLDPPYFRGVLGDPRQPRPSAVFAPRGAGKTAQRRMTEARLEGDVLCVTHNTFDVDAWGGAERATLGKHLSRINELVLIGLCSVLGTETRLWSGLAPGEQQAIRALFGHYLERIDSVRLQRELRSLATLKDRQIEFLSGLTVTLGTLASYAWSTFTGTPWPGPLKLPRRVAATFEADALSDFKTIGHLAEAARIRAVYVLVDGVDETSATQNDVRMAYRLIASLMENLGVVETAPYAFKFFIPDSIRDMWIDRGGRQDRITPYETRWTEQQLREMVGLRLNAFLTRGEHFDVARILGSSHWEQHALLFAEQSPRNLIRLLRRWVDEATNKHPGEEDFEIDNASREAGTNSFTYQRALEIASRQHLDRLQRLHLLDFTIGDVQEKLAVHPDTARRYVRAWQARGIVEPTTERARPGVGRPGVTYALASYCVARQTYPELSLDEFVQAKVRRCPAQHPNLRDWELWTADHQHACTECGAQIPWKLPGSEGAPLALPGGAVT